MNYKQFVVTRQHYYYDGGYVVEVAQGGVDYSGSDALCRKYKGEFDVYTGMEAAVEAAISIAQQWKKDCPNEEISIAAGCNHGYSMEFEGKVLTDEVFEELRSRARSFDAKLPRCPVCSELIEEEWTVPELDYLDEKFCSGECAERAYYDAMKNEEEIENY